MTVAQFHYRDSAGNVKPGQLNLEDYAVAEQANMRVSGLVNQKYSDADRERFGTAFEQGMRSLGIYPKGDPVVGIMASTVREVMTGECMSKVPPVMMQTTGSSPSGGGTITSPGQPVGGSTPASRVFFPEVIMTMMDEFLRDNWSREVQILEQMIASKETIASEVFTQPMINTTAPQDVRPQAIGQNALPRNMVSITTSQTSKAITTTAVGLQISEQAQAHSTLDLVRIIVAEQAEGERKAKLWEDISNIANGNIDAGQAAMTPVLGSTFDAGFTGGVVNQAGWMKLLWDPSRKIQIDSIICDFASAMAIQNRSDRPLIFDPRTTGVNTGNLGTYGMNQEPVILNFETYVPNIMIVPDGIVPASHLLCFDSRFFLRRVTNSSASYSATEKMVLQRSDFFRWDAGELLYRLREEAGQLVDFS